MKNSDGGLIRETKINIRSDPKTRTEAIGFTEAAAMAARPSEVLRSANENRNAKPRRGNFRIAFNHEAVVVDTTKGGKGIMARNSVAIILLLGHKI